MYLKSLELQGFKSFPDKTVLDFGKGLTAVVGPNGSGKSNIGDAVRWVLGEQSSKTLRGGKMEDVIFGGTEKRKPVSFASVTLNISNEDHTLNVESEQVSVMRRLWRNGDSEYSINGAQVRLKDILELFMDTGLGRDGYSIIGQGRVADIVGSKSNERREIFEEAAGISKFRYKKAESERRLASAEDNILRLKDILSELEGRVEPLRIQSEKAKKYLVLAEERKTLEVSVWAHKLTEIKDSLSELGNKLLVQNGEYELLTNEIAAAEEEINELAIKRRQCSASAEEYREKINELTQSNATAAADIAVFKNNIKHYGEQIEEFERKIGELSASESETKERIEAKKKEISEIAENRASTEKQISELEEKLRLLNDEGDRYSQEYSGSSDRLNALYIRRSELKFTLENSKNARADAERSIEEIASLLEDIKPQISEHEKEKSEISDGIKDIEKAIEGANNKLSGYNMLYSKKSEQLKTLNAEFSEAELNLRNLKSRRQMLIDLDNSMEGYAGSVKSVVSAAKSSRLRGVRGTVAGLVSVEPKYSVAIETALGGALQNIVVDNEEAAKAGIRFLKETNGGRATFLPLTSVKGNTLRENGLDMQEGYVAIASELVSREPEYDGIIASLLGRIVIAENIDLATNIAKKYGYKFRIITLDGQVINAGGSFTGGSTSRSTGMLTRKNEIAAIENNAKRIEAKNQILKDRLASLSAEVEKLSYDVEGEREEIQSMEADKIRFEGELKNSELLLSQLITRESELNKARGSSLSAIESADKAYEDGEKQLSDVNSEIEGLEELVSKASQRSDESRQKREQLSNELSDTKLKLVELAKDIEAAQLVISQLSGGIDSARSMAAEYNQRIAELNANIAEENENISEREVEAKNAEATIQSLNTRIKSELDSSLEYERRENEIRQTQRQMSDRKETVSAEITRLNERIDSTNRESESIISQLWEAYSMTVAQAYESAQELEDVSAANKHLNELKSKIRALGTVNTDAIDEYKEVSERYEFLNGQLSDVTKSKSELERLISELTKSMKEIFSESFAKINENFKQIFVELFGGGKAELKLTDPDNVLESGIEINVAPPGKVIKNLSLLSGGEQSFVAIAIYFAILKLRPSPFCILDEIEAALDDVNVTRYAQYLRNFTDTTQFIVVTHRRGTMEEADVLYGVTMQEKGVSKLLKMDVSQAVFSDEN